jgi:hypothetical protein
MFVYSIDKINIGIFFLLRKKNNTDGKITIQFVHHHLFFQVYDVDRQLC